MIPRLLIIGMFVTLLIAPVSWSGPITTIQGAPVATKVVATGVTTNTTTSLVGEIPNGAKTFFGQVMCTSGLCTQTQKIYGSADRTTTNGILLCTITLSGTPNHQDACPVITAAFPFYYIVTTNTTGTNATGAVYAMF